MRTRKRTEPIVRFMRLVDTNGPYSSACGSRCWVWTGAQNPRGYGGFYPGPDAGSKTISAHRWFWVHERGAVPDWYELDHICRNTSCVRLEHLRVVTRSENLAARPKSVYPNFTKERCVRGHEYDYRVTSGDRVGHRICRACAKERQRRYRERKRSQEIGASGTILDSGRRTGP